MWPLPSGTLGWRAAKAEAANSKARKSVDVRVTAIFTSKTESRKSLFVVAAAVWKKSRTWCGREVDEASLGFIVEREK